MAFKMSQELLTISLDITQSKSRELVSRLTAENYEEQSNLSLSQKTSNASPYSLIMIKIKNYMFDFKTGV